MSAFPWITVPKFARPGQLHAFADRADPLSYLYRMLASAGNSVREGRLDITQTIVVHGYVGVGKSALIVEALGLLRGELVGGPGQRLAVPNLLPEPLDIQQWIVMYVSGKRVADVDGLTAALQQAVVAEGNPSREPPRDPFVNLFSDMHEQAARNIGPAPRIPILHSLFNREESKLQEQVRTALRLLGEEIEQTRRFSGGKRTETFKEADQLTTGSDFKGKMTAGGGWASSSGAAKASVDLDAGVTRKVESSRAFTQDLERQSRVTSERLVAALNRFFAATRRARIPTILVIDDFDEVTSSVGSSRHDRSQVLSAILGPFTQLQPTSLILGLRDEYMHEDISRIADTLYVPPLTRSAARDAVAAWAEVQQPALLSEQVEALQALGDRFYRHFSEDDPVVVPFDYLQFVSWLANNAGNLERSDRDWLLQYLRRSHPNEVVRIVQRIAERLSADDMHRCVECGSIDPAPFDLLSSELELLMQRPLARPANAGDRDDSRVVLNPMVALLRAASNAG